MSGTAEDSVDIAAVRGMLTFPPGSRLAAIPISITDDFIAEPSENFIIGLQALIATVVATTVNLRDNDAIRIFFERPSYTTSEGGQVNVGIGKSGEANETVCVSFSTEGGTAMDIVDYIQRRSERVCFLPSMNTQDITVDIVADDISEAAEIFLLRLMPVMESTIQVNLTRTTATVTIVEDQLDLPSAPQNLSCSPTIDTINCNWEQRSTDTVANYLLTWRYTGPCDTDSQSFLLDDGARSQVLEGLEEGGNYEIVLTPMNSAGAGTAATVEVTTEITAPSGVPLSVRVTASSTDSATIRWRAVNCLDANGVILQYTVSYTPSDSGTEITSTTADTMLTITGLSSAQDYSLQVAAINAAGIGPFSEPIIINLPVNGNMCASGNDNCDVNARCISTSGSFICLCNQGYSGDGVTCSDTDECSDGFNNCDCNADCLNTVGSFMCSCREGFIGNGFNCTRIGLLMVQFDRREHSVVEGDTAQLTCTLNREAEQEVSVEVFTFDITTQGVNDYAPFSEVFTFAAGETSITIRLVTVDESELAELNETLRVSLSRPSDGLTLGEVNTATVTIVDNDVLAVEFVPSTYFIIEGESLDLTIVLSLRAAYSVSVTVSTEDGLSTAPEDFTGISMTITFPPGLTRIFVPVNTINDRIAEIEEDILVLLSNPSSGLTLGELNNALVFVEDNDEIRIGFVPAVYTFDEDLGAVNVTVAIVDGILSRGVTVELSVSTEDDTAIAPNDYEQSTFPLTFSPQVTSQNVSVVIVNDNLLENQESFNIQLELGFTDLVGDVVLFANRTASVNIRDDDDAEFEFSPINVTEGVNQIVRTTLRVVGGVLGRSVSATVSATANSAEFDRDFSALTSFLPLSPRSPSQTYIFTIIDDDIFEDTESLLISAEFDDDRITPVSVPITIFDNDNVSIGFTQFSYNVIESSGTVNIAVALDGRISRPIEILIATRDGSATSTVDYVTLSSIVTFAPSANSRQVINVLVTIINDAINEDDESFNIIISAVEQNPLIAITQNATSVTIINDDVEARIGFEQTAYSISEDGGSVVVTIGVLSGTVQPFRLSITTQDGTATAPDDYTAVENTITFDPQFSTTFSQSITIELDSEDEDNETFTVVLAIASGSAIISPDTAIVTIINVPSGCSTGDLRLQGGSSQLTGRLEICEDGVWGTICETNWDDSDATVACRQLGFSDQGAVALSRLMDFYPPATDEVEIFFDEVDCAGTELRLEDCVLDTNTQDCLHFFQDAGVECQPAEA